MAREKGPIVKISLTQVIKWTTNLFTISQSKSTPSLFIAGLKICRRTTVFLKKYINQNPLGHII